MQPSLSNSLILLPEGPWLLGCGYNQKKDHFSLPFHVPAPKGLIVSSVSAPKSSKSGEKCPMLDYVLPLPQTCLEDLLLGSFFSVNLMSI